MLVSQLRCLLSLLSVDNLNGLFQLQQKAQPQNSMNNKAVKQINTTIKQIRTKPTVLNKLQVTKKVKSNLSPNASFFAKDHKDSKEPQLVHYTSMKELPSSQLSIESANFNLETNSLHIEPNLIMSQEMLSAKNKDIKKTGLIKSSIKPSRLTNKFKHKEAVSNCDSALSYGNSAISKKEEDNSKIDNKRQSIEVNQYNPFSSSSDIVESVESKLFKLNNQKEIIKIKQQFQLKQKQLLKQIEMLTSQNQEIKVKINKYKCINQENKKSLRDQINSFNMEGEEIKRNKQQIDCLYNQNQTLKRDINTFEQQIQYLKSQLQLSQNNIVRLQTQNEQLNITVEYLNQKNQRLNIQKDSLSAQVQALMLNQRKLKQQLEAMQSQIKDSQMLPLFSKIKFDDLQIDHLQLQSKVFAQKQFSNGSQQLIRSLGYGSNKNVVSIMKQQYVVNVRQVQETYHRLIDQLKSKIVEVELQNFQLSNQLCDRNNKPSPVQLSIGTDHQILVLVRENSLLKQEIHDFRLKLSKMIEDNITLDIQKQEQKSQIQVFCIKSKISEHSHEDQQIKLQELSRQIVQVKNKLAETQKMIDTLQKQKKQKDQLIAKLSAPKRIIYQK